MALLVFPVLFFVFTPTATAQITLPGEQVPGVEQLVLRVNPSSPGPGQTVTAEVTSTLIDLNNSIISWIVNGATFPTPQTSTKISLTAPSTMGAKLTIKVVVKADGGLSLSREQTIRTGALDLLWEADSYTPPFYKGKALPAAGSNITVNVLPDLRDDSGKKIPVSDLVFTWKQNSLVVQGVSGRGKNVATFPGPEFYTPFEVWVEVASLDQSIQALGALTLEPFMPNIIFYESHPTLGIRFEEAITDTLELGGGEVSIAAQPFYFAGTNANSPQLTYQWVLNGANVPNPNVNKNLIVLRADTEGGAANVGLGVKHLSKIFQEASKNFMVNFTGTLSL